MISKASRKSLRKKRHNRLRNKVSGSQERPRMVVFRSARHIYAQVIDDVQSKTLASSSTLEKNVADQVNDEMSKVDVAKLVGKAVAEKAKQAGVEKVVFDRAGYKYHGRVKALADGAREGGLSL